MNIRTLRRRLFPVPTPDLKDLDGLMPVRDAMSFDPTCVGEDCFVRYARSEDPPPVAPLLSEDAEFVSPRDVGLHGSVQGPTGDIGCYVLHDAVYEPGLFCVLSPGGEACVSRSLTPYYWRDAITRRGVVMSRRRSARRLDAVCIACLPPYFTSYGHALLEMLPRIWLAQRMLGDAWPKAKLLLDSALPEWARDLLRLAGASDDQFVFLTRGEGRVRPRVLLLPTPMHGDFRFHSAASGFFDDVEDDGSEDHPLEIYLPRGQASAARRFENEDAVMAAAQSAGLTVVEPWAMPWRRQVSLFRKARLIVGAYGSSLHNAMFSGVGANVLAFGFVNHIQACIAQARGQGLLLVQPSAQMDTEDGMAFHVSPSSVKRAIEIARSTSR